MTKRIGIARETRRVQEGLAATSRLLTRTARVLARLVRHTTPEQFAPRVALGQELAAAERAYAELAECVAERPGHEPDSAAPVGEPARRRPEEPADAAAPPPDGVDGARSLLGSLHRQRAAAESVFQGTSPALPIHTVLDLVGQQQMTGTLHVATRDESFVVEFRDGDVVHAVSDATPLDERLGSILLKRGALGAEQLQQLLDGGTSHGRALGEALHAQGLVERDALRGAVEEQVLATFRRLFVHPAARYWFEPTVTRRPRVRVRLNVTQVLLEAARTTDEGTRATAQSWDEWMK